MNQDKKLKSLNTYKNMARYTRKQKYRTKSHEVEK